MMKAAELRIKELEAHLFAVTESLKHFTHAAKTGEGLMQAVMSAETVLESTPKQSLESVTQAGSLLDHDLKLLNRISFELGANGATGCETILNIIEFHLKEDAARSRQEPKS